MNIGYAVCAQFGSSDWSRGTIKINANQSRRSSVAEHLKFSTAILEIVVFEGDRVENKSDLVALEAHFVPTPRASWT